MKNSKFFLKDTASILSGAFSTFSALKNEIDNIVKSRFEKFINDQGVVSREDFEALVDRHEKLNAEFNLLKIKLERKIKVKDKNKK
ncbi:accessory factor UbiK family protein [Alphaproteobacteria bacterium]|jgi:BMFP domain-containing protein YqiC|nr:accessory factor UbiK family protein [Alphaproteobacteria bacterium]|tara:strand:- start:218 stop:475 length:258 start_codon:yes stop_codon:yes gene_type:complete